MSEPVRCELVTWSRVEKLSYKLSQDIGNDGFCPEIIVTIARGGYVPARLLCDYLDIGDLRSIRIIHYLAGAKKQRTAELVEGLCHKLEGSRVLLVDDISDTGDTLELAYKHLISQGAGEVRVAVLHHKQTSTLIPDYIGQRIVKWRWITYPWAIFEDVTGFINRMAEQPSNISEAAKLLLEYHGLQLNRSTLEKILANQRNQKK